MRESCIALAYAVLLLSAACAAPIKGSLEVTSVNQLKALMYREQADVGGCYKLLNATGAIGCEEPSGLQIEAPLIHLKDLPATLTDARTVLVPATDLNTFLQRLLAEPLLLSNVKGILVDDTVRPAALSYAPTFPGAAYAPYSNRAYPWNPAGSSVAWGFYPVPVMLLSQSMAADAQERAAYNQRRAFDGGLYQAKMRLTMNARAPNASACLEQKTCKPVGGYSVWGALPPLPANASISKPTILVVAQVDSLDFFHDSVQGADAPLSGLLAMLAAADALGSSGQASGYSKQLVFLALAGEPWDYMGSRRFLWELASGGITVQGLVLDKLEQVIEVGQVGRARSSSGTTQLYLHRQQGAGYGDAQDIVNAFGSAVADGPSIKVAVQAASAANPGIPPSSLMSFLRINASITGAVLSEFDTAISNPLYMSRFDDNSTISAEAVSATSALLAATLHRLAGGNPAQSVVNATALAALQKMVDSLVQCLVQAEPGLSCDLAARFMTPGFEMRNGVKSYAAKHYVGVLQVMHPDPQNPFLKSDVSRFIWNFMALATAMGELGSECDPVGNKCSAGQVCAAWRASVKGRCVNATVHYVPSLSTAINCTNCQDYGGSFRWVATSAAAAWNALHNWPPDPMWVESDWPLGVPFVQLFLRESDSAQLGTLLAGLVVTAASGVAAMLAKRVFHKHYKGS